MKTRNEARTRAIDLAFETSNVSLIKQRLEEEGFGGLLEPSELESIIIEADWIRQMIPDRPKKTIPRIVGLIALIMGIAALCLASTGTSGRRHSPRVFGFAAVIFGIILIVKPSAAGTDI